MRRLTIHTLYQNLTIDVPDEYVLPILTYDNDGAYTYVGEKDAISVPVKHITALYLDLDPQPDPPQED